MKRTLRHTKRWALIAVVLAVPACAREGTAPPQVSVRTSARTQVYGSLGDSRLGSREDASAGGRATSSLESSQTCQQNSAAIGCVTISAGMTGYVWSASASGWLKQATQGDDWSWGITGNLQVWKKATATAFWATLANVPLTMTGGPQHSRERSATASAQQTCSTENNKARAKALIKAVRSSTGDNGSATLTTDDPECGPFENECGGAQYSSDRATSGAATPANPRTVKGGRASFDCVTPDITDEGLECTETYISIEISLDDGNTWTVWWQGYATVCE
jgi:hypothetical protein